jgi:hypothetical protein
MATTRRAIGDVIDVLAGRREPPSELGASVHALYARVRAQLTDSSMKGFAISTKEIGEGSSGEQALVFYVREKLSRTALDARLLIPPVLIDLRGRAIMTDVRQVGELVAHVNAAPSPIRSGFSVGHPRGAAGTVAAVVRKNGQPHLLSAQHVLAANDSAAAGDTILFPAAEDGGSSPAANTAILQAYTRLVRGLGHPNRMDAALAAVIPARQAALDPAIPGAVTPLRAAAPREGARVRITGRTSNVAHGTIKSERAEVRLQYAGIGFVGFTEQVECTPYGQGGDSGALVLGEDGAVLGLHIGGSSDASFFTPIATVATALGFQL